MAENEPSGCPSQCKKQKFGDTSLKKHVQYHGDEQMYSTDLSLQEFGKWVASHGGYIDPSLILHRDRKTGEISVLLKQSWKPPFEDPQVPKKLVSTPTSLTFSLRSPPTLLPDCFEKSTDVTAHSKLCFRICSHILLGGQSSFYQYFRQLPEHFGTPLELSEHELSILQGTNAFAEVPVRKNHWMEEWKAGVAALGEDGTDVKAYTWPLFLRAALIISSRAFPSKLLDDINIDGYAASEAAKDPTPILIPLWDFLNHKITPVTWLHNENELELLSNGDISKWRAGDEVFNNYGPKGNEELLLSYGFCLGDSPSDYVSMKFKIPPLSPGKQEVRNLLPSSKDWPPEDVFFLRRVESSSSENLRPLIDIWPEPLLDVFRLLVANEVEEELWKRSLVRGGGGKFIFPSRLDLAVAAQLHRATSAKLAPILEAKAAKSGLNIPESKGIRAAKIYRDAQITILQSLVNHLSGFLAKYDFQNRMTFARLCASDKNFPKATSSHYGKAVEEFSSDDKDEALVAVIVHKYLQCIYKTVPKGSDPWWAAWFQKMRRVHPFPWEEVRLKIFHSDDPNITCGPGEDETGDEAGTHIFEDIYEPLRNKGYFFWDASPGLCSWAFELLGISGTEIDGELVLAL